MRPRPFALVAAVVLVAAFARPVLAVSPDDLVNLHEHGLSDEILVAVLQTDGSVFSLTASDVLDLRKRGLSDVVLLAMVKTARPVITPTPAGVAPSPLASTSTAPSVQNVHQTVVVQPVVEQTVVQETVVVVPPRAPAPEKPAPVYWGFGGRLRSDAWKPAPSGD
jgi:hypothetical protein